MKQLNNLLHIAVFPLKLSPILGDTVGIFGVDEARIGRNRYDLIHVGPDAVDLAVVRIEEDILAMFLAKVTCLRRESLTTTVR